MMTRKTSLKDIAQAVGVSTTLVSYVLNNKKENRISKEVAQKIRQAAQDLNYRPNQIAKSLKLNKTRTLGLIVADIANPFSAALARVIEDEADRQNYTVIFGSSEESPEKFQKLTTTLLNRQVDGLLIAAPAGTESQLAELQKQAIPFVLIDRYFPALKTSYVALDNAQAMYKAVRHLINSGYQNIGLVSFNTSLFHICERGRGYRQALQEAKLPVRKSWQKEINNAHIASEVSKAIQELVLGPKPVEAIVFASNTLTIAGLKQLKRLNKKVPTDLAVVGFDEAEAYELFETPLTYIKQPVQEIGELATQILLDVLNSNNRMIQANLEAALVIQDSTRPVMTPVLL
ncbi:LacI family DNA-binding transcriptional regulator [Spirosoma panaciterrae]|uniref:LacI family DNA-binding transcriptional regulator n=1 Tax=Spirosoma panaciterrae TaxID=496058 RepID=UPI0004777936|nr:LacI family DNA-binding transcriptional regulator [Spirosoma panaciterrae]